MINYGEYLSFRAKMIRDSCYKTRWYKLHCSYIRTLELTDSFRNIYDFPFYPNINEAFWGVIQIDFFDYYVNQNIVLKDLIYGVDYVWCDPLLHKFTMQNSTDVL